MEEKEEKNLQIRERESRRSGVWNDLRCEAGKSQKYRAERPYEIFLAELISCSRVFDREAEAESRRGGIVSENPSTDWESWKPWSQRLPE